MVDRLCIRINTGLSARLFFGEIRCYKRVNIFDLVIKSMSVL